MTMTIERAAPGQGGHSRQSGVGTDFHAAVPQTDRRALPARSAPPAPKKPVAKGAPKPAQAPKPAETSWLSSSASWLAGVAKGDFEDNASTAQVVTGSLISMIPIVDQICDVRDLTANVSRCVRKGRVDASDATAIALTAIGFVPVLGSAVKGALKILLKAAKENAGPAFEAAQAVLANPALRAALEKLADGFAGYRDQAMGLLAKGLTELSSAGGALGAFVQGQQQAILSGVKGAFNEMRATLDRFLGRKPSVPSPHRAAPDGAPGDRASRASIGLLRLWREMHPIQLLDMPYGKAFRVADLPELAAEGMTVQQKARMLLNNMLAHDVNHVILGKGGDKGQLLAALQKLGGTEFALCRVTQPLAGGRVESALVLVRGDAKSVRLPRNSVCIAHTHPGSGMAWRMPSVADQQQITHGRKWDAASQNWESQPNLSELIIHGDGSSYRYVNFMAGSPYVNYNTRIGAGGIVDKLPSQSVREVLNKAHMQLASVEGELTVFRERMTSPLTTPAEKRELREKIFFGSTLKRSLEDAINHGQQLLVIRGEVPARH